MSSAHIAGFMTTNLENKSISESFLSSFSVTLAKILHTKMEHVTLELQTNISMVKAGSSAPMLNLRLFHNSDQIDSDTKHEHAKQIAAGLARLIRVPEDRVLVLFIDTRYCNAA